jgi:hypothetical protein
MFEGFEKDMPDNTPEEKIRYKGPNGLARTS